MSAGPVLRDIHVPAEPSWWPPAPGWWMLAAVLLALVAVAIVRWRRARRLQHARRELQAAFDALRDSHPSQTDGAAQVAAMSLLLRRASKRHAPAALALRDHAWLTFLDADDPSRPFSEGVGQILLDAPYRAHIEPQQADELAELVRRRLPRFVQQVPHA